MCSKMLLWLKNLNFQCLLLFCVLLVGYWVAIPGAFNTIYQNRIYFDSDGEFITRQFRNNATFTHNDHLLYHVMGRAVYKNRDVFPSIDKDRVVGSHKILSVFFGALGVALLYRFGSKVTGRRLFGLLASLFVGVSSGYFFFSTTIDTYVPCLCAGILALGAALRTIDSPRLWPYVLVGVWSGVTFLFRTDGFLMATLAVFFLRRDRSFWRAVLVTVVAGFLVAVPIYFLLAHYRYDIPWRDVPSWGLGYMWRHEGDNAERIWGLLSNINTHNLKLVLYNHLFYGVVIPGLRLTRSVALWVNYKSSFSGYLSFLVYLLFLAMTLVYVVRHTATAVLRKDVGFGLIISAAATWFVSRWIFYTWWDPYDPFLFAVMSIPALWLLLLSIGYAWHKWGVSKIWSWAYLSMLAVTVLFFGLHNIRLFVRFL